MFSKPSNALKDENERLKAELKKQSELIISLDSLTAQSVQLQRLDKQIEVLSKDSSRTLELAEKNKESDVLEAALQAQLQEIRKDTLAMEEGSLNRKLAGSFTNAFDALVTYRYNITALRSSMGPSARCANEVAALRKTNDDLKRDMERMSRSSTGNDCAPYIFQTSQLQLEKKELEQDKRELSNSITNYIARINDLQEKLKAAAKTPAHQVPTPISSGISEADLAEARAYGQVAEIDCILKQADPSTTVFDDGQRLKIANSALQKIGELERSSNPELKQLGKAKRDAYNKITNAIKKGGKG
jgi:hypothetical protein